ncbi:MAG TPA: MlaD family protein [Solirubrobacterales bacterium]|nr:MlaD family protein [Solirubrobacterales bacterium]
MRRIAIIGLLIGAVVVLIAATASGDDGNGGSYKVRAYFDSAGFLVNGEDVRIAGATVGTVEEVTVSLPGETVTADGGEEPGKAVAVLDITDSGFEDFLADASCLIRPQSLLGEKYVECVPTQPRAPGSEAPPALEQIPDGEIGAGQYRLPIENNGKQVDLDLVNNITRQPEIERFRLILNDLGAGLAARGPDLAAVLRRANPALEQTDKVLATLAKQNRQLAELAKNSDTILEPLSRERQHFAGFIRNAATAGTAAAERRDDIVAGFAAFPNALRQLESTMVELQRFSEQATPVAINLREAAPGLTDATRLLGPFSRAANVSITNLGENAVASEDDLAASSPVIRQLRKAGEKSIPGARNLNQLLMTLRRTGGIDHLMNFILNASNTFNNYDQFGHFLFAQLQITNCVEYDIIPITGCDARWFDDRTQTRAQPTLSPDSLDPALGLDPTEAGGASAETSGGEGTTTTADEARGTKDLLNFLIGSGG